MGVALERAGRLTEAIRQYEQALRIKPDYVEAQNNLAWLLATLTPAEGGDPVRAVALARQVCEITNNRVTAYLDTLAAAHAAAGRFNDAMTTAQRAIELAGSTGQSELVGEIQARLQLYRGGRAYRQTINDDKSAQPMMSRTGLGTSSRNIHQSRNQVGQ